MTLKMKLLALVATLPAGIGLKEVGNAALDAAEQDLVAKLSEKLPGLTGVEVLVEEINGDHDVYPNVEEITLLFVEGRINLVGDELQAILEDAGVVRDLATRLGLQPPSASEPAGEELQKAIEAIHGLLHALPRVRDLPFGRRSFRVPAGVVAQWNARLPVPDARFPNLALRNTYVYHSPFEDEHSFDRAGYWNSTDGWTTLEGADLFDADQSCHSTGPFDPKGEVKASRLLFHVLPELRESIRQVNAGYIGKKPDGAVRIKLEGVAYRNGSWFEEIMDPQAFGLFMVLDDGTETVFRLWEEFAVAHPHALSIGRELGLELHKAAGNRDLDYLHFRNLERKKNAA